MKFLVATILLLGSFLSGSAIGAAFTISPIRIELTARAPMVAVTVRNNDTNAAAAIQTQTMSWAQVGGKDVYEDTRALVVSPPIFTLAPGGEQVVRIALRSAPAPERESLFRVYFQELPGTVDGPVTSERKPSLRMLLRMGIPVILQNDGTGHLRVTNLAVTSAQTGAEVTKSGAFYVLPGQWWASDDFPVVDTDLRGGLRLTASTNTGDLDKLLQPDAP